MPEVRELYDHPAALEPLFPSDQAGELREFQVEFMTGLLNLDSMQERILLFSERWVARMRAADTIPHTSAHMPVAKAHSGAHPLITQRQLYPVRPKSNGGRGGIRTHGSNLAGVKRDSQS